MYHPMKDLTWLADSRSRVKSFPAGVQDDIGSAYDASGTYRAVYTVSIGESIYVIHAFQKKSKAGITTPKSEMELIRQRLKQLRSEVRNAEKRNA
jgi:phage-related protein